MTSPTIGIYGGTFDPPHIAHLVAAERAAEAASLDRVLMVVANEPWQKVGTRAITDAALRLEMLRSSVAGSQLLEASDLEIRRGGPSYTIDTIRELRSAEPGADLAVIVGADAAAGIHTWREPEAVRSLARLVVIARPGHDLDGLDLRDRDTVVHMPALEVSSSELRERIGAGLSVRYLVHEDAIALAVRNELYRGPR